MEDDSTDRQLWKKFRSEGELAPGKSACPDANELGAFLDGRLSGAEREAIERHLLDCDPCLEALVEVRAFLAHPPPRARPVEALAVAAGLILACALGFFIGWRTFVDGSEAAGLMSSEMSFGLAEGAYWLPEGERR